MASNVIRVGTVEILALSDGALAFDFFPAVPKGGVATPGSRPRRPAPSRHTGRG
jgi:hypothetical protein